MFISNKTWTWNASRGIKIAQSKQDKQQKGDNMPNTTRGLLPTIVRFPLRVGKDLPFYMGWNHRQQSLPAKFVRFWGTSVKNSTTLLSFVLRILYRWQTNTVSPRCSVFTAVGRSAVPGGCKKTQLPLRKSKKYLLRQQWTWGKRLSWFILMILWYRYSISWCRRMYCFWV